MNSEVVKFVAGGGKTTESIKYIEENNNGIYLAFTNSVVDDIKNKGYLAKTIDSFFMTFIIPKFISLIPIIPKNAKIKFIDSKELKNNLIGISNIHIDLDGKIYNRGKYTGIDIMMNNEKIHKMNYVPNLQYIKYIFSTEDLKLTDELRAELSLYLIKNYENEIVKLIESRFSYVLIDEAQDLNRHREALAQILYKSNIKLILFGDDYQNINGGGNWFEELKPKLRKNESYRCPEDNCKWIRENLDIDIKGNNDKGGVTQIAYEEVLKLDDGKRTLLYSVKSGKNIDIVQKWKGRKKTIKTAKGSTIYDDIVIIGNELSKKNMYTAITRTKKNVYTTVKKYK